MTLATPAPEALLSRLENRDSQAVLELFTHYRDRLETLIRLRMDRRLRGRLDPTDVLQETYLEVARRASAYASEQPMPVFLWLRWLTREKLLALHRQHLGTAQRDAEREIGPGSDAWRLAEQILDRCPTPSSIAVREERSQQLHAALAGLEPLDREVLILRHFEHLSNGEVAQVLQIHKATASARYLRALQRLKNLLAELSDFRSSAGVSMEGVREPLATGAA